MVRPVSRVFLCMRSDENIPPEGPGLGDPVAAAALDWFVRLRDDAPPEEELHRFTLWRDADPAHAEAFTEIEALWSDMDAVPSPRPLRRAWDEPAAQRPRSRAAWPLWGGGAIAASLALALAAPPLWLAAVADARTGTAEVRHLTLADGSRVSLDADSAIAVAIDADGRRIRLLRGRAWFSVAHESRPFTVAVGDAQVRDIGTAFEVTQRDDGGEVAVTAGLVELTSAGGRALRLSKGQAARFGDDGRSRLVQTPPTPIAWRSGRLQFVAAPLSDVLDDLARYGAGRPFMLADDLARRRITGAIDLAEPAAARDTILARVGARAQRIGPFLLVTRRP